MLPGKSGFEICEAIREVDREQPIIMLTAKSTDEDVIQGLALGADDYVDQALFRRAAGAARAGRAAARAHRRRRRVDPPRDGVEVDPRNLVRARRRRATCASRGARWRCCSTSPRTASARCRARSCCAKVWGYARHLEIETRTVDIHVAKLRRKIERDPKQPRHLRHRARRRVPARDGALR